MTKLDAGLMTPLPASDSGSAAVWGSKRINPQPQSCLYLAWSGCPSNDDEEDDEVSVERAFSGLKYIVSPLQTNMSEQLFEDVLLIRGNHLQYFNNKSVHFMFFETCQYVNKKFLLTFHY